MPDPRPLLARLPSRLGKRCGAAAFMSFCVVAAVLAAGCGGDGADAPKLRFAENTPGDLREFATATWSRFDAAFSAHRNCTPPVELAGDWDFDSRGIYEPDARKVIVGIPGTAAQLESALIHEFAHHVEFNCEEHLDLRPGFLDAQGFPEDAPWARGTSWQTTPSEHWAEAAIEVVRGHRLYQRNVAITLEARELIAAWGQGELDDLQARVADDAATRPGP